MTWLVDSTLYEYLPPPSGTQQTTILRPIAGRSARVRVFMMCCAAARLQMCENEQQIDANTSSMLYVYMHKIHAQRTCAHGRTCRCTEDHTALYVQQTTRDDDNDDVGAHTRFAVSHRDLHANAVAVVDLGKQGSRSCARAHHQTRARAHYYLCSFHLLVCGVHLS